MTTDLHWEANLWSLSPYDVQVRILWTKQRGMCALCQRPVDCDGRTRGKDQRTLDHIRAISQGGRHNIENVQLVHMACNSRKGNGMKKGRGVSPGQHVGIRKHNSGYQAFVNVGGKFYSRMFPQTATRLEMQDWRYRQRDAVRATLPAPGPKVVTFTDEQKAELLNIVREAVRGQAVGDGAVLDGVRRRLYPYEVTE
jgi:hypothetical protein